MENTRPMTAPTVDTPADDAIAKASDEISRISAGRGGTTKSGLAGRQWTMCIPVRADDSDEIFSRLVIACKRLQAENRDLLESQLAARREVEALAAAVQGAIDVWSQHAEDSEEWSEIKALCSALAATPEEKND